MSNENHIDQEDPTWRKRMSMLTKRKKVIEIEKTLDEAFHQYYAERGLPVPDWKQKRDPDWWCEYLIFLGIEPDNP